MILDPSLISEFMYCRQQSMARKEIMRFLRINLTTYLALNIMNHPTYTFFPKTLEDGLKDSQSWEDEILALAEKLQHGGSNEEYKKYKILLAVTSHQNAYYQH